MMLMKTDSWKISPFISTTWSIWILDRFRYKYLKDVVISNEIKLKFQRYFRSFAIVGKLANFNNSSIYLSVFTGLYKLLILSTNIFPLL